MWPPGRRSSIPFTPTGDAPPSAAPKNDVDYQRQHEGGDDHRLPRNQDTSRTVGPRGLTGLSRLRDSPSHGVTGPGKDPQGNVQNRGEYQRENDRDNEPVHSSRFAHSRRLISRAHF